jgi:hemerythrin-like domain-containing protein
MRATEPLRVRHRALLPAIDALRDAADAIGDALPADVRARLETTYRFLAEELVPRAHAEEVALYPVVGRALGAARATATMSRDHVEILRLTRSLGAILAGPLELDRSTTCELRAVLYGLYGIVRLHLAKEEEIYFPVLDQYLSDTEAAALVGAMDRAARAEPRR